MGVLVGRPDHGRAEAGGGWCRGMMGNLWKHRESARHQGQTTRQQIMTFQREWECMCRGEERRGEDEGRRGEERRG